MSELQKLKHRLNKLRTEHKAMEKEIVSLIRSKSPDLICLQKMKKKKLKLKEEIEIIEAETLPDIIA